MIQVMLEILEDFGNVGSGIAHLWFGMEQSMHFLFDQIFQILKSLDIEIASIFFKLMMGPDLELLMKFMD